MTMLVVISKVKIVLADVWPNKLDSQISFVEEKLKVPCNTQFSEIFYKITHFPSKIAVSLSVATECLPSRHSTEAGTFSGRSNSKGKLYIPGACKYHGEVAGGGFKM